MRFLAAVDVHDHPDLALQQIAPWAERLGAVVDLTYASTFSTAGLPPPTFRTDELDALWGQWAAAAANEERRLLDLLHALPERVRGSARLLSGRPAEALAAEAAGYDLLAVVSHQRHGLSRLVSGSVSAQLLRSCPVPLLVLGRRDPSPPLAEPVRILAPVEAGEAGALPWIARHVGAQDVQIVHVRTDLPVWSTGPPRAVLAPHPPHALTAQLRAAAEEAGFGDAPITLLDPLPNPGDSIVRLAAERSAHLIALPTHGLRGLARLVLGSVAERVVARAPCAVLVVPWALAAG